MNIFLIILLLLLDQGMKFATVKYLSKLGTIPVITDFFHLTYVENRGAAFGMLQNQRWIFVVITLAVIACMILYSYNHPRMSFGIKFSMNLIAAGAVGNLIDRLFRGFVIDMFDFRGVWPFVFNFADMCVVVGGILIMMVILFDKKAFR